MTAAITAQAIGFIVVAEHEDGERTAVREFMVTPAGPGLDAVQAQAVRAAEDLHRAEVRRDGPYSFTAYALTEVS